MKVLITFCIILMKYYFLIVQVHVRNLSQAQTHLKSKNFFFFFFFFFFTIVSVAHWPGMSCLTIQYWSENDIHIYWTLQCSVVIQSQSENSDDDFYHWAGIIVTTVSTTLSWAKMICINKFIHLIILLPFLHSMVFVSYFVANTEV